MLTCKLLDAAPYPYSSKRPGDAWFCPWYWDPKSDENRRKFGMDGYLSQHYWKDWAALRPPLCIVCPNGAEWVVDAVSTNGTGWTVTGAVPFITATPSIHIHDREFEGKKFPGYHGFLQNGVFTRDLEGRTYA